MLVRFEHESGITNLYTEWGGLEHCGSSARERKPAGMLRCFSEGEIQRAAKVFLGREFKKPWEVGVFFIKTTKPLSFRAPTAVDYAASPKRGDVEGVF